VASLIDGKGLGCIVLDRKRREIILHSVSQVVASNMK
jgi:hypothetical protein